jgi:hypothetical protein
MGFAGLMFRRISFRQFRHTDRNWLRLAGAWLLIAAPLVLRNDIIRLSRRAFQYFGDVGHSGGGRIRQTGIEEQIMLGQARN